MVELNIYTFTYVRVGKEETVDMIAADPEIAVQNFERWAQSRFCQSCEIHEITLLAKKAIYYKTNKRKR